MWDSHIIMINYFMKCQTEDIYLYAITMENLKETLQIGSYGTQ